MTFCVVIKRFLVEFSVDGSTAVLLCVGLCPLFDERVVFPSVLLLSRLSGVTPPQALMCERSFC